MATRNMKVVQTPRSWLRTLYIQQLLQMSTDDCRLANDSPFEYLLPCMRLLLDNIAGKCANTTQAIDRISSVKPADPKSLEIKSDMLAKIILHVEDCQKQIQIFHKRRVLLPSQQVSELLSDLDDFLYDIRRTQKALQDSLNRQVSLLALKESKKSIQQVESGKRLSQLAYIYLPLAFSSSLFGMNIAALQNSTMASFIITTVVLLSCSLLFWLLFLPLQQVYRWLVIYCRRIIIYTKYHYWYNTLRFRGIRT